MWMKFSFFLIILFRFRAEDACCVQKFMRINELKELSLEMRFDEINLFKHFCLNFLYRIYLFRFFCWVQ